MLQHRNFGKHILTPLDGKVVHILKGDNIPLYLMSDFTEELSVRLIAVW